MNHTVFSFGEMLWDVLPSGRHAGGAPFNVASHLAQLGIHSCLISAVGLDTLGDELLEVLSHKNVDTRFVTRADLQTGVVHAKINERGDATYDIVEPVAWDKITVTPDVLEAVAQAEAFNFGSLATRSPHNMAQLEQLLTLEKPLKFFDVNMRPPFADPSRILTLAARADVIKLNNDEVARLAAWIQSGTIDAPTAETATTVATACGTLAQATGAQRICVTMASAGALFWDQGTIFHAAAPQVAVKDTVGAGDAFMAGLITGLTNAIPSQTVLETACRLGAYVASHDGATPLLPLELRTEITSALGLHP